MQALVRRWLLHAEPSLGFLFLDLVLQRSQPADIGSTPEVSPVQSE